MVDYNYILAKLDKAIKNTATNEDGEKRATWLALCSVKDAFLGDTSHLDHLAKKKNWMKK